MISPELGETAPDAQVFRPEGSPEQLASTWADSDVALIFLRHYG
ncbi:MAG: hypothetical protein ABIS18_00825 [Actinomycetota bacterium]